MHTAQRGIGTAALIALLTASAMATPRPARADTEPEIVRATRAGDVEAVRRLAKGKPDVEARASDGSTALHWAVRAGDARLVTLLLEAGADAAAASRLGVTPLSLAAANGDAAILGRLLRSGASPAAAEQTMTDGQTLLMLSARTGSVEAVKLLIERGADVNARERRSGTTALVWAAMENRGDVVRALARAGADVDARSALTTFPHTPPAVVGDKLEDGVSYVGQTVLPKGGWTPLMYAAREGAVDAVRALAELGANLDATDPEGTSALIFSIINGHFDVATALVEKGANPNLADNTGMTPLYAAVDLHTVAFTFGRPDPPPAVFAGSVAAVKMLLDHGADPNARLRTRIPKRVYNAGDGKLGEGATPLMRAARSGDAVLMRMLLGHGADASLTQKNGNTLIILASGINARGINADRATEQGAVAAIALAMERGIDVNTLSASGDSAVHAALGSPMVLRYLIEHGARLDVKNRQGRTPLEAALANRDTPEESIALLRQVSPAPASSRPSADSPRSSR